MPIYEYRCEHCAHELEKLQRMSDDPLKDCPACGQPALKKRISAAGFRLKGGGWYETDFKSDKKKNLAGDQKSDSKKTDDKKAGGKSEKKSEAKSGTKQSDAKKAA